MPGTVSDPQRQISLPPSLQHRTDLGPSREDRRRLESGHSTNGYSSGTGRERVSSRARVRPKQSAYKPNHPLLGEIERLLASCDSHEREIRAAQNTINHQLAEWAGKFDTLHELDTKAEQMTFEVKRMTQKASKEHNEMVDSCIRDAKGWVAETRDNMQLWKQTDHDRDPSDATDEKEEVIYTWKQWEAQIELVKRQYENEQERLDRLIADKKRYQKRKSKCTYGSLGGLTMLVAVIWILLWTFEWRQPTTLQ